jgi:hypothetical protein
VKLKIQGKLYDYLAAMNESSLGDYRDLKRETGFGRQSLFVALLRVEKIKTVEDVFEDEELMSAFIALIWLCKRYAGEPITLAEAEAIRPEEFEFEPDEEDLKPPVEDPTVALVAEASQGGNGAPSSRNGKPKKTSSVA